MAFEVKVVKYPGEGDPDVYTASTSAHAGEIVVDVLADLTGGTALRVEVTGEEDQPAD